MPAPTLTPTTHGITQTAARWRLEVDSAYNPADAVPATPSFLQVFGIADFSPGTVDYTEVDDSDYDSVDASGVVWGSSTKTGASWAITGTINLKKYGSARDPGAAFLEDACDTNTVVHVAWFDRFGTKAYEGYGSVKWTVQGGAPTAASTAQFEIKGNGARTPFTNPVAGATVPNAVSVLPTTGPAGTAVVITGTNFVGIVPTTGVKFGSTNAALFRVDSDTQITAVVPTGGSAGAQNILVTNAAGADPTTVAFTKS
jgi:hypothetical protein